jgi:hypothetical protein
VTSHSLNEFGKTRFRSSLGAATGTSFMLKVKRLFLSLILTATVLGFVGSAQIARGQEEDELEKPAAEEPQLLSDDNIYQWAFGNGENAAKVHTRLDLLLSLRVEYLEQICGITEGQKKKLQLAGRGDIKRVFDRVETSRTTLKSSKDNEERNQIIRELSNLQGSLQNTFFERESLFSKTLKRILNQEQLAKYEAAQRETRRLRHRAVVDVVVEILDEVVGFRDEQRQELAKILVESTRPVKNPDRVQVIPVLFCQLTNLPDSKFAPILDNSQSASLKALLLKMKEELGQTLDGVEFEDQVVAGNQPPAAAKLVDKPKSSFDLENQQRNPSLDTTP